VRNFKAQAHTHACIALATLVGQWKHWQGDRPIKLSHHATAAHHTTANLIELPHHATAISHTESLIP